MYKAHPLQTAAIVILLSMFVASLPHRGATDGLDPSWNAVLQYAAEHRLAVGSDIVFTYGPLGHLVTSNYAGGAVYPRMLFEWFFVFLNILPVVLVANRMPFWWSAALYGLVALGPTLIVTGKDGLVQYGMLCWGLLCFISPVGAIGLPAAGLATLTAVGGLVKFSWLIIGTGSCVAILIDLLLRRAWLSALTLIATASGLFCGLWWLRGQPLGELADYLTASASIASGYASAMGVRCSRGLLLLGIGLLSCASMAIVASVPVPSCENDRLGSVRRGLMSLWIAGLVFISWKYGFTRADGHVVMFGMFAGILPLLLLALPSLAPRYEVPRQRLAMVAVLLAMVICEDKFRGVLLVSPATAFGKICQNVGNIINPQGYAADLVESWRKSRDTMSLPAVRHALQEDSVDVFGYRQTYAIANELTYTPRPVFQSYSAYTRELAARNAAFYRSGRRPDWVLFDLAPIDGRMPSLEDSSCLVEILRGYRYVDDADPFLLLKKDMAASSNRTLLEMGVSVVGRVVDLGDHASKDIWLEVEVATGLLTRVESALLRPPSLRIRVHADPCNNGAAVEEDSVYNAPLTLLSAGFLLSPLVRSNEDVKQLLVGGRCTRVNGFTLEPSRSSSTLRGKKFTYRLYGIDSLAVGK